MDEKLKFEERIITGIELGESHFREFKSAYERRPDVGKHPRQLKDICRDIGEVLAAFSNADGGELFIGVEDDGSITGIPHKSDHLDAMKNAYISYVHELTPLDAPSIKIIEINGNKILYFHVTKSIQIVHLTCDGRCLQRHDRENKPVPPERIQNDRQELISLEYERRFIANATIKDLDIKQIESVIKHLGIRYSPEKFLQLLDLAEYGVDGLKFRHAALLLFARNVVRWHPRCAVRILRVRGKEIGTGQSYNVDEVDMITGNIVSIVDQAWDALKPHVARTKFQANSIFRESIIYPEDACRETLINAIAHRDYSIEGKPIEILIFEDRMEVRSPGRLLSSISVEDLKQLKCVHQSRNVFIARVLRELGVMRELGEGIGRIYSSVRSADLVDPEILSDLNSFIVTLFHRSIFSQKAVEWLNGFSEFHLSKNEQRVILIGQDGRLLSTNDIMKVTEITDTEDFTKLVQKLNQKGIIFNSRPKNMGYSKSEGPKKSIPRFQIRPPHEAKQYLEELEKALMKLGPIERFNKESISKLKFSLTVSSPYCQNPWASLRALEYIGESSDPLPRARSIWSHVPTSDLNGLDRKIGKIVVLFHEKGYGFAKTSDGDDFYLHVYQFINTDEWSRIRLNSRIEFKAGEMKPTDKTREAKAIRLLDPE